MEPKKRRRQRPRNLQLVSLAAIFATTSSASCCSAFSSSSYSARLSTSIGTSTARPTSSKLHGSSIVDDRKNPFAEFVSPRWSPWKLPNRAKDETGLELPNMYEQLEEIPLQLPATSSVKRKKMKRMSPEMMAQEKFRLNRRLKDVDMTLVGVVVSVGILYGLAIERDATSLGLVENVNTAAMNIADTAFPATTYDVVAVALGETVAGVTGAAASLSLNLVLANANKVMQLLPNKHSIQNMMTLQDQAPQKTTRVQGIINEAAAETDYFLARAAVLPLLVEGVGLSPAIATLASSLVATLPYQAVKLGKQQREARQEENRLLQKLLLQEQQQQSKQIKGPVNRQSSSSAWNIQSWVKELRQPRAPSKPVTTSLSAATVADLSALEPIQKEMENTIDGVELFADTCKWLSYSVLMNNFSGTLMWPSVVAIVPFLSAVPGDPTGTGVESGFFGLLATLTSLIYADFLYFVVRAGPPTKQAQVRSRAGVEWLLLYVSKSIGAFTLFGVYASVQLPVRIAVNALLSGGIDSCIGSVDVDMCMETYYVQNPPAADMGAQLRAIATTFYSFTQMPSIVPQDDFFYSSGWAGGGGVTADAQLRAIITTLVSLWSRIFY